MSAPAGAGLVQQRDPPPQQPQPAGTLQAAILLATVAFTPLVLSILGPSLPAMQQHFAGTANVEYLVPMTLTAPTIVMATLSVLVGLLADRVGRKRILITAATLYAFVGTAPLWLGSLGAIIASRIVLGALDAVLMTVGTVLIGDYYHGARREKLMALQATMAAVSAFVFNNLGGVVAEAGWRAPYAVYAISLLLVPLMALYLWEPAHRPDAGTPQAVADDVVFQPFQLFLTCVLALITGIVFLTLPVHVGYLFNALGVQSPTPIGVAAGCNSLGVIIGTFLFGWWSARRLRIPWQLVLSLTVVAIGFVLMRSATSYTTLTLAGALNGVGCGLLLPTMVTWNMRILPFARRGFGTGAYQSCYFLGIFINPLLIVWLDGRYGGRATAVGIVGIATLVLAALIAGVTLLKRVPAGGASHPAARRAGGGHA